MQAYHGRTEEKEEKHKNTHMQSENWTGIGIRGIITWHKKQSQQSLVIHKMTTCHKIAPKRQKTTRVETQTQFNSTTAP